MFKLEPISPKMLDYYVGRSDSMIIDLRDEKLYEQSHILNAVNISFEKAMNGVDFPMDKVLVFYCERGGASLAAAKYYYHRGYTTRSMIGGILAYNGRFLVFSSKS